MLQNPYKSRQAAQFLGQAFVTAYIFLTYNKAAVEKVADEVFQKKEIFGDDLNRLLDSVNLQKPEIDWAREDLWPRM